ncbi:MAG: hypothetical protein ACKOW9_05855, partial [Candidatus Paceibacterota bacterium]
MHKSIELKNVITLLSETEHSLEPDLLRSVWRLGIKWGDDEVISLLTKRKDLPEDIVNEASKLTSIPVRVSYLCRGTLGRELFLKLLGEENRAGVLAGVCSEIDIAAFPEISDLMQTKLKAKPSKSLSVSVIERDGFTPLTYALAFVAIADSPLTGEQEQLLRRKLDIIVSDYDAVGLLLNNDKSDRGFNRMLYILGSENIDESSRNTILLSFVKPYVEYGLKTANVSSDKSKLSRYISKIDRAFSILLRCDDVQQSVLDNLKSITDLCGGFSQNTLSDLSSYDPKKGSEYKTAVAILANDLRTTVDNRRIQLALTATDVDKAVLTAVGKNPNLDHVSKELFFTMILDYEEEALDWVRRERNDDFTLKLYEMHPRLVSVDKFAAFSSITNGITLCLRSSGVARDNFSYNQRYLVSEVVDNIDGHEDLLRHVPWSYLADCSTKNS